jgi:group II intron reverse transcriptase/maturase
MSNEYLKIAEQVRKFKTVQNIMQHINRTTLHSKHKKQIAKKATGVDGITKAEYDENINKNLENLVIRMKKFSFKPQPVRRVYIAKIASHKLRPLGIPSYEDKLVQGVMADILNTIYEHKFLEMSYGFRPNRSCHHAILDLNKKIMCEPVNYIVDVDIKGFFDNVNHEWLIKFLEHDIEDKNFIRYIKRFLRSGIMEQGKLIESDKGTPQGGLISPILANVYLHYVLDLWFEKVVKKNCVYASIVRYADDFACCFKYESDAEKFLISVKERLSKFGLEIAVDKTKIMKFGRFQNSKEKFDFLGITHINGVTRKGNYKLIHHTSNKKLKAKMQSVKRWLYEHLHEKPSDIIKKLNIKLMGHYRYYGISNNYNKLSYFQRYCIRQLYKALNRRSQKKLTWSKYSNILKYNPIAKPKIYVSTW